MRQFITYICILTLPILVSIGMLNYLVDPAVVLNHKHMDETIAGIQQGNNVTNVINIDERVFKRRLAQIHSGEEIDYLILGPSQMMTISKNAFPDTCNVLNLSMSACRIEDYIAMYEICKECNLKYLNVILGIDPSLFNEECEEERWVSNSKYYYRYLGQRDKNKMAKIYRYIENLFSISYFQESWHTWISRGILEIKYTEQLENELNTYSPDGSLTYGAKYREAPQEEIDNEANYWEHHTFKNYKAISPTKQQQFEWLLNSLQSDSINIYFMFCPYHPLFYKRLILSEGFCEAVDYLYELANRRHITIMGAYRPSMVGFDNTYFYDAAHVKKEYINRYIKINLN